MSKKNIIKRIISSPLVQTFLVYISGGWLVLEMTDYFINKYGLNERISDVLPVIMLIGLPVALFLAWYLSREKEAPGERAGSGAAGDKSGEKPSGFFRAMRKKPWFTIPVIVVLLLLLVTGVRSIHRQMKTRWATETAIPEIENYSFNRQYPAAFLVLNKAMKYLPEDPETSNLINHVCKKVTFLTDPPGAEIYVREYAAHDREWERMGSSPIDSIRMPGHTFYECRIEKDGYEPLVAVLSTNQDTLFRKLFEKGTIPEGMVHVIGYRYGSAGNYLDRKNDFFMDRYEVTNKQYKEFVDAGGYRNPEYWKFEFVKKGKTLTREEAMSELTDKTDRPGPADWEAGTYPDGQDHYPVSGVSWYEAAAYAAFAGKELPTVRHWYSAAGLYIDHILSSFAQYLIPLSNMKDEGPAPAGHYGGMGCYGNFDMAGNVREWCWNETQDGRAIMGGGWNDVSYVYSGLGQAPPFDRSLKNGFRCVIYSDPATIPEAAFQSFHWEGGRDFYQEEPVSGEVFEVYRKQFLYDRTDLQATIEEKDETRDIWIREKVTFRAAYENERMIAYLYLPREGKPPYQTLIFFPGSYAVTQDSLSDMIVRYFCDFLPVNNIAVMCPIYKGTYERNEGLTLAMHIPNESHTFTEYLIKWVKDLSRSIDYLETRPDIDPEKIGFYGHSWGGRLGGIIPAVEDRIRLSVLNLGGLSSGRRAYPEADILNYVTRIKRPVLMLNGRYDVSSFPYETDVQPMYDLLGTPEEDKVLKVYETDHYVPKTEMIKETLDFMEKYFGPSMQ